MRRVTCQRNLAVAELEDRISVDGGHVCIHLSGFKTSSAVESAPKIFPIPTLWLRSRWAASIACCRASRRAFNRPRASTLSSALRNGSGSVGCVDVNVLYSEEHSAETHWGEVVGAWLDLVIAGEAALGVSPADGEEALGVTFGISSGTGTVRGNTSRCEAGTSQASRSAASARTYQRRFGLNPLAPGERVSLPRCFRRARRSDARARPAPATEAATAAAAAAASDDDAFGARDASANHAATSARIIGVESEECLGGADAGDRGVGDCPDEDRTSAVMNGGTNAAAIASFMEDLPNHMASVRKDVRRSSCVLKKRPREDVVTDAAAAAYCERRPALADRWKGYRMKRAFCLENKCWRAGTTNRARARAVFGQDAACAKLGTKRAALLICVRAV